MNMAPSLPRPVLADALAPGSSLARSIGLTLAGSLLVALSAQASLHLPFSPVPITGQTFAVLLVGAALGPRLGFAALLLYLAQGMAGLPVFAGFTGGMWKIAGPTGGYLMAFPIAAAITGWLVQRFGADRTLASATGLMVLGNAVVFLIGVSWLSVWLGISGKGTESAIAIGLTPFIPGALLKAGLAAGLLPTAWRLTGRGR